MDRKQIIDSLADAAHAIQMTAYSWGNPSDELTPNEIIGDVKVYEQEDVAFGRSTKVKLIEGPNNVIVSVNVSAKSHPMTEDDLKAKKERLMDELAAVTKLELELEAAKITEDYTTEQKEELQPVSAEALLENMEEDKSSPDSILTDLIGRVRRLLELDEAKQTEYGYDRYSQGGN